MAQIDSSWSAGGLVTEAGVTVDQVTVTPETLYTAADLVAARITAAEKTFSDISRTAASTASYWLGDAGDKYRSLFQEQEPEIEEMIARFREHTKDLQAMAANYIQAENEIKTALETALPTDVIV